jgi:hypothetical protein
MRTVLLGKVSLAKTSLCETLFGPRPNTTTRERQVCPTTLTAGSLQDLTKTRSQPAGSTLRRSSRRAQHPRRRVIV